MIGCTLSSNSATFGGGAYECVLSSCRLIGNTAADTGGGVYAGTLSNCTLTGNSARRGGGVAAPADVDGTLLYNCIVFHNTASSGSNYPAGSRIVFRSSCAAPLPPGPGNIEAEPQFTSDAHLFPSSPCIGAGSAAYSSGVDIDGETWADPPCIGADQVVPGNLFGPIDLSIQAGYQTLVVEYAGSFTAIVSGRVSAVVWDFGDGTILSNQLHTSHAWTTPGIYTVRLTGYNDSFPAGFSTGLAITVIDGVYYVNQHNLNPVVPYASWETAATNIQDAIGAAALPGRRLVLVTNGVYRAGTVNAAGLNRVALTNGIVVRSVNGPVVTVIDGESNGVRCAYLGSGAVLSGFTLRGGQAERGGGAWGEVSGVLSHCMLTGNSAGEGGGASAAVLHNCTLSNNWAFVGGGASSCALSNSVLIGNSAEEGGGAAWCDVYNCPLRMNSANGNGGGAVFSRLYNCTLTGNLAGVGGGGAESTSLFNCTLTGNSASLGGGAIDCALYNCIASFNSGLEVVDGSCTYSCTTPLFPGEGNIANEPAFVNAAAGDFRLSPASPCINAGRNANSFGSTDLEGLPRIAGETVDMGAYEFEHPTSRLSYAWLQQYGLPTDGSADDADPDSDLFTNWHEWRAGTCPTNALSLLRLFRPLPGPSGVAVSWQSVNNRNYFLDRSTNLGGAPVFVPWKSNLVGQAGTTTVLDADPAIGAVLYRVGVQE
jgi:parallel beta-helix repeat protein